MELGIHTVAFENLRRLTLQLFAWAQHQDGPFGAALIGDWVCVAGGGAVLGGSVESAVHEAFTLG